MKGKNHMINGTLSGKTQEKRAMYRIPNLLMAFPLDFLPLFLGISYFNRVSRQDAMRDPFITPLHISNALS